MLFQNSCHLLHLQDKQLVAALEEMQTDASFPELAILHELVYSQLDEESRKRRETQESIAKVQQTVKSDLTVVLKFY